MFTDFSISALIAGFVFSVIGWSVFKRGRTLVKMPLVYVGIAMLTYSYFIGGRFWPWLIGLGLTGAAYYYWE